MISLQAALRLTYDMEMQMSRQDFFRRDFLRICGLAAAASSAGPTVCAHAAEAKKAAKPLLRFAVASDIHFGQAKTPFKKTTGNLIQWLNTHTL